MALITQILGYIVGVILLLVSVPFFLLFFHPSIFAKWFAYFGQALRDCNHCGEDIEQYENKEDNKQ